MSISPNGGFGLWEYQDDTGATWGLILSSAVATAGSFGSADPSLQPWPARNRRHRPRGVHGVTSDGLHHAFLPLPTEASLASVWSTGTFNIGTTPYVITSRVGEKFVKFKPGTI